MAAVDSPAYTAGKLSQLHPSRQRGCANQSRSLRYRHAYLRPSSGFRLDSRLVITKGQGNMIDHHHVLDHLNNSLSAARWVCFLANSDDIDPHDLFYEGFPNYSEMKSELLVESVIMEAEDQLPATNDHFRADRAVDQLRGHLIRTIS
jgi:hypothetical protein